MDYTALKEYTTSDAQSGYIDALIACSGNKTHASKMVGTNHRGNLRMLKRIEARAAASGYAPNHDMTKKTPEGFSVKGVSTLYDEAGNLKIQWVKTHATNEQVQENFEEFIAGLCESMTPAKPSPLPKIKHHTAELMTSIFIGDAHVGMYAYGKETKHADFDSDIATEQLRNAVDYLVAKAEPTETGLLVDVGDYVHVNGQNNQTYSGTPQDTDTRHSRVMHKAAMCMRYMIEVMLAKFKKVVVVIAKGNHDTDTSVGIRLAIDFYYSKEPRVNVLETDSFYHYIEYGQWLLGVHHGDKQKPESLAGSMARDMPAAWGRTSHRMWCVGHFHKEQVKTLPGVKYKVFAALPPPDSWHASKGYSGDGEMEMITFRKSGGIYSSHVFCIPQKKHEPDVQI